MKKKRNGSSGCNSLKPTQFFTTYQIHGSRGQRGYSSCQGCHHDTAGQPNGGGAFASSPSSCTTNGVGPTQVTVPNTSYIWLWVSGGGHACFWSFSKGISVRAKDGWWGTTRSLTSLATTASGPVHRPQSYLPSCCRADYMTPICHFWGEERSGVKSGAGMPVGNIRPQKAVKKASANCIWTGPSLGQQHDGSTLSTKRT
ncbi:uncharacterized protein LOC126279022 [Schistocerca gregaria]|uniref:uncharacterized protein LOC126279022 n=1 Tax=Schistocerca gregaria TaxID=7010 RepID=UPI00211F4606|nr:uncharacterized protein LOC126279022 [Schistocerca gregaria]